MTKLGLVTGAATGLGEAISRRLHKDNWTVILTDIDGEAGQSLTNELGENAHYLTLDVRKEDEWLSVFEHVKNNFGSLQLLVNNAGITTMGTIEDLSFEAFQHEIQIDLFGVFLGCKHVLPLMKEAGGSIINMSSAAGLRASANLAGYNAAKAAVTMLTKSVALHYAASGYGIRVNSVHPGAIHTAMLDKVAAQVDDPKALLDGFVAGHPIGRLGQPNEVAALIAYIASDEAAFATGAEFVLDGGLTL